MRARSSECKISDQPASIAILALPSHTGMQLPRDVPWYARIVRLFRWFHQPARRGDGNVAQMPNLTGSGKNYGARCAAADIETSGARRAAVDVLSVERRTVSDRTRRLALHNTHRGLSMVLPVF
jgi:hypothetical protein